MSQLSPSTETENDASAVETFTDIPGLLPGLGTPGEGATPRLSRLANSIRCDIVIPARAGHRIAVEQLVVVSELTQ